MREFTMTSKHSNQPPAQIESRPATVGGAGAMNGRIVLAGGSGFLGQVLAKRFSERDYEVVILTRSPKNNGVVREVDWNGRSAGAWSSELEGARALINLAGRSVNCRYHTRNRKAILESRVESTRVLGEAIGRCRKPPRVWLNASTATIYKHSIDRPQDETTGEIGATPEAKDAFSIEVAVAWEKAFEDANASATRKVALRSAMVLGPGENSVFPALRRLARFGLGGSMAGGRQFVSWIHEEDFFRAIEWLIEKDDLTGPVNLAAPNPVPNREVMRIFRRTCGVPFGLPAALWMLETGAFLLRTETELIIKSRRVVPGRLLASGFQFRFSKLEEAVKEIEQRMAIEPMPARTGDQDACAIAD
jgi:uncharacterized protein